MPKFKVGDIVILDEEWLKARNVPYETIWVAKTVVKSVSDYGYVCECLEGSYANKVFAVYRHNCEDALKFYTKPKKKGFR